MTDRQQAIDRAQAWLASDAVVLDTETTGLDGGARIVEIAVVGLDGDVLLNTLVDPCEPIPAEASAIHGITDQDVAGAEKIISVYNRLLPVLQSKLILVYNAPFDRRMLLQSLWETIHHEWPGAPGIVREQWNDARSDLLDARWGCIMDLYAQFYGDWSDYHGSYTWQRLGAALDQCGLSWAGSAHRALGDARAALAVLRYMANAGGDRKENR